MYLLVVFRKPLRTRTAKIAKDNKKCVCFLFFVSEHRPRGDRGGFRSLEKAKGKRITEGVNPNGMIKKILNNAEWTAVRR